MAVYAIVKIKEGANISHDFSWGVWPQCKPPKSEYLNHPDQYEYVTLYPNALFVGEKKVSNNRGVYWTCTRPGYGITSYEYGNGSIGVSGPDCVEVLTPMLGFKPDLKSYELMNNKQIIES